MLGERKTRGVFNEGRNSEWSARMQELMPAQTAPAEPVVREPAEVVKMCIRDRCRSCVDSWHGSP